MECKKGETPPQYDNRSTLAPTNLGVDIARTQVNSFPLATAITGINPSKLSDAEIQNIDVLQILAAMEASERRNNQIEEQLQKNHERTNTIAHDFRNPLAAILGYAGLIQKALDKPIGPMEIDNLRAYVNSIRSKGLQMNEQITEMLTEADTCEPARTEDLPTAEFLRSSITDASTEIMELGNIEVIIDIPDQLPQISTVNHEGFIYVQNILISNAVDALIGIEGGKIIFHTKVEQNYIVSSITDNGSGMDEERLKRCFIIGNSSKQSSGAGLAIAKKIVEGFGGDISAKSEVNKGSTFSVYIPISNPEVQP